MLNQAFSPDNFRKLFDYENRKGVYLEGQFFPDVEKVTQDLKNCMGKIRDLQRKKATLSPAAYKEQQLALNTEKQTLRNTKENLLTKELEKVGSEVANENFQLGLKTVKVRGGKTGYRIENKASAYFAMKQAQESVQGLYKVKPNNAYNILCQLRSVLGDAFPKYVIRTDIEHFYESNCFQITHKHAPIFQINWESGNGSSGGELLPYLML
jgi:hypothetical protein